MKSIQFSLLLLLSCSLSYCQEEAKLYTQNTQNILRTLTGVHTALFVTNDLFEKPLNEDALHKWNETIAYINSYVTANIKNLWGIFDNTIYSALKTLNNANNKLIKNIHKAYTHKDQPLILQNCIYMFTSIKNKAASVQKKMTTYAPKNQHKHNAQQILTRLAITLKTTANAALNHLQKYVTQE